MTENEAKEILATHYEFLRESWKPYPDIKVLDAIRVAISSIDKIQQYRAIGTVEGCREARERQRAKKPRFYAHNYYCGNCGSLVGNSEFNWKRFMYCDRCGNPVNWSE